MKARAAKKRNRNFHNTVAKNCAKAPLPVRARKAPASLKTTLLPGAFLALTGM